MRNQIVSFFAKQEMLKNMAVLTGGTAVAQLFTFAASPILARIYTEDEYGSYGIFTSIISYFVVISCLRLDQAIVIPKSDEEGRSIAQWAIKITTLISSGILLISIASIIVFQLSFFYLLIAPTVFFIGLINIYNYYSTREKAFKFTARARVFTGIVLVIISVILGYLNYGAYGLIGGMFLGQIAGGSFLFLSMNKKIYSTKNVLDWRELYSKYRQFIVVNTPHALFDLTESAGVVLLLGFFFDKSYIGAYYFAVRILKTPLGIVGSSIYQVFYKEITERFASGKSIFPLYKMLVVRLAFISLPLFIVLFLFGKELFIIVFGNGWSEAGRYAELFAAWFWLNFVVSSISCIPIVVNKQNIAFFISVLNTLVRVTIILLCGFFYDFETLIYSFATAQTIIMLLNNYWYYFLTKKYGKASVHID